MEAARKSPSLQLIKGGGRNVEALELERKKPRNFAFTTFSQSNGTERQREPICHPDDCLGAVGTEDVAGVSFAEHELMQARQILGWGMSNRDKPISPFH